MHGALYKGGYRKKSHNSGMRMELQLKCILGMIPKSMKKDRVTEDVLRVHYVPHR